MFGFSFMDGHGHVVRARFCGSVSFMAVCVIRPLSFSGLIIAVISRGATVSAWLCSKMSFGQRAWTSSKMNDCISHYPQCWVCILSSLLELNWRVFQKEGMWYFATSTPCWFTPHLVLKMRMKTCKTAGLVAGSRSNVMTCWDSERRLCNQQGNRVTSARLSDGLSSPPSAHCVRPWQPNIVVGCWWVNEECGKVKYTGGACLTGKLPPQSSPTIAGHGSGCSRHYVIHQRWF